ncbi:MAG: hypothetical protein COC06_05790 [Bacteroidales bacterium]|nr:MAG: hypothetical protein COC06_05790 [Bacteroidales bacterium]
MSEQQRNDNKEQERANFYKVLVAIKYALSINDYDKIIIEHKGDVTFDNKIQIEVKHVKENLSDKSKEFWNTFYNWITDPDSCTFESFILHTTQKLSNQTIFKSFGNNYKTDLFRLKKLYKKGELKIIKKGSSKYYFNEIFHSKKYTEDHILTTLQKIKINHSQLNDEELISDIAKNHFKVSIPERQDFFVNKCLGGTIASGVAGRGRWEISKKMFYKIINDEVYRFLEKPSTTIYNSYMDKDLNEDDVKNYYNKNFVKKLNEINCEDYNINDAITDYWRTTSMIIELQDLDETFIQKEYTKYQKDRVFRKLRNEKDILDVTENNSENRKRSLGFYKKAKTWAPMKFESIPELEYIQHGTMHRIAEDPDNENFNFHWLIGKK